MRTENPNLKRHARAMRRQPSAAENRLWQALRNRQFDGEKFVRQEPIGPFIADFVCRRVQLVIEVDGPTHEGREAHDARRTKWLAAQGYHVLRFTNDDALGDLGPVLDAIRKVLADIPSPSHACGAGPNPLPSTGEGTCRPLPPAGEGGDPSTRSEMGSVRGVINSAQIPRNPAPKRHAITTR